MTKKKKLTKAALENQKVAKKRPALVNSIVLKWSCGCGTENELDALRNKVEYWGGCLLENNHEDLGGCCSVGFAPYFTVECRLCGFVQELRPW